MIPRNFVAISGVSNEEQLGEIHKICQEEGINFPIAIGYQVSNKSINQGTQNPRQPRFIDLGNLSKETLEYRFVPAVHYYTKDNQAIPGDLEKIAEIGVDPNLALLQFNTLPPSIDILRKGKEMGFGIIFKVAVSNKQTDRGGYAVWKGKGVQDVKEGEVNPLINQILERKDFIDYAMFDPSHGTNLDLDLDESSLAIRFGREIASREYLNHLGLVYAGGIKPTNVRAITRSFHSFFPNRVSIDIESGVRKDNQLNLDRVRDYLIGYKEVTS
ncbi:hypothetical protein ES703_115765 [subsurface metagenome]